MPLTIRDAEDSALGAWTDVQKFMAQFLKEWTQPIQGMIISASDQAILNEWDKIPPEGHAQLEAQNPQGYQRAKAKIVELKQKYAKTGGYNA